MLKSHETHQDGKRYNGYSPILMWGGMGLDYYPVAKCVPPARIEARDAK